MRCPGLEVHDAAVQHISDRRHHHSPGLYLLSQSLQLFDLLLELPLQLLPLVLVLGLMDLTMMVELVDDDGPVTSGLGAAPSSPGSKGHQKSPGPPEPSSVSSQSPL